jgi:hypothetical protein
VSLAGIRSTYAMASGGEQQKGGEKSGVVGTAKIFPRQRHGKTSQMNE